jgi:hypothetical protein
MNRPRSNHCQPATRIVTALGGVDSVRQATGTARSTVYGWMQRKQIGGTDGLIPFKHIPTLLALAKDQGVSLSADDFLPGSRQ